MEKINQILHGDCTKIMSTLPPNSIPLIYADPPYNLSGKKLDLVNNNTGGAFYKVNEAWDTFKDNAEYLVFTEAWIEKAVELLKKNGSMYISCTQHNISEVIATGKKMGLKVNNILTWYKTNAMPNITKRTFTHATEFVVWFVKGANWIFNYEVIKQFNPNKTKDGQVKQMRDFLDFIELPIVQGQERLRGEEGRAMHPTQKPLKLMELIILASSSENDVVLDPFFGTGTTGVAAMGLKRNFIGIEMGEKYYLLAKERIEKITLAQSHLLL